MVKVFITPRKGILDPQGRAAERSLKSLGFDNVRSVHIGRLIVLDLDAPDAERARELASRMCDQLLANPLIEDWRLEVDPQEVELK